jgi:DNA-binding NtrC family response regulator
MLIDDEADCLASLSSAMEPTEHHIDVYDNPEKAMADFLRLEYQLVITDMKMPQMTGIEVLQAVKKSRPETQVIIITGYGDAETAIAALNNGAFAFFGKPVDIGELLETIDKVEIALSNSVESNLEHERIKEEYEKLRSAYLELKKFLEKQE